MAKTERTIATVGKRNMRDMTVGSPLAVMIYFSLPLLVGNIVQSLYNTANSIILGRMVGSEALAAAGASAPIQNMFFVFYMTVGSGITIVVAQYFGAKDKEQLSQSIGSAMIMTLVATLTISAVGIPLSGVILRLTDVDASIYIPARHYLMIMFAGAISVGFYNVLSGILRGMGDSVFPLIVLVCSAFLNVALDLLFVGVFGFGVPGAACATVISQTLCALACLWRVRRGNEYVVFTRATLRPVKRYVLQVLRIGLPSGVQQTVLTMASVFVQKLINGVVVFDAQGVVSTTIFVAAATAFTRVDALAMLPSQAFSIGGSTFAGQNIGAGRLDRVKKGFNIISATTLVTSIVLFVAVRAFGGSLMRMFIDPNDPHAKEIVEWGVYIINIMAWDYIIMAFMQPANGVLRGAGDTLPVMIITIVCTVFMRVPMAYIWVKNSITDGYPNGRPDGIYWSMVICFTCAALSTLVYYMTGKWQKKALVKAGDNAVVT